jgi:8-hydroxy-5-deazaflavin:NADPH oxidoreductase
MKIAVLGVGHIGSAVGRLWHSAGHETTFAGRDEREPRDLVAELGARARAATVADAVAGAGVVLVAVPGPAVTDVLTAAGRLDGRIVIDAANMMGPNRLSLRQLADAFPAARWVRAFNPLQARVLAGENHRLPRWVLFLSGDEQAKPAVVQLIEDAGFEPVDLGGIEDSRFQEPGSALWNTALESGDAKALAAPFRAGHAEPADRAVRETARSRTR